MTGYAGDMSFDYPFDIVLDNTDVPLQNEAIRTDTDSDFLLYGLVINAFTSILFTLQFRDSSGNYFSSLPVYAGNYAGQGTAPYLFPGKPRIFPPGSQLGISIQNLSAATNTIQLLFRGEKRFVKPQPVCAADALTNRLLVGVR
jgi:hypothetical protein